MASSRLRGSPRLPNELGRDATHYTFRSDRIRAQSHVGDANRPTRDSAKPRPETPGGRGSSDLDI